MRSAMIRSGTMGYALLTAVLLGVVTAPFFIPGSPATVFARKYGKNYGAIYAKYIARCKAGCGRTNGAIAACINRAQKLQARNCLQVFKADRADCTDKSCVKGLKSRLKLCKRGVAGETRYYRKAITGRYGVKRCDGCCQRTKGQGDCLSYFSSSFFYGSNRYQGHLNCTGPGSPSGAFVNDWAARIRSHMAGWLPWLIRGWNA